MFSGYDEYESIIDFRKKEYFESVKKQIEELAINAVCPNTHNPTTIYEKDMVRILTNFGILILETVK